MPENSARPAASSEKSVVVTQLKELATAFVTDPFNPKAICDWYIALAKNCPLWTLQERAYHRLIGTRRHRLHVNHAWALMRQASDPSLREPSFWSGGIDFEFRVLDAAKGTVDELPDFADLSVAPKYLVHAYGSVLLRPRGAEPLSTVLTPKTLRIPEVDPLESGDLETFVDEIMPDLDLLDELRGLVVARDLAPSGEARNGAQRKLDVVLNALGLTKRGRPSSIPKAKRFVKQLMKECRIWLRAEHSCQGATPSGSALKSLDLWGCSGDPQLWAERIAFPFLTPREIGFLRGANRPPDDRLTAVYLVHCRLRDNLTLCTAADYALGTRVKEQLLPTCWSGARKPKNPLCPS